MAASGQKPGRLPELATAVQIDTTLHRSEIRVSHGFQRFDHSFNRTAVNVFHNVTKKPRFSASASVC
jgi:hypothetical protein